MPHWIFARGKWTTICAACLGIAAVVGTVTREALAGPRTTIRTGHKTIVTPQKPGKKHHGGHMPVVGDYQPCNDNNGVGAPTSTQLTVHFDTNAPNGQKVTLPAATSRQAADVFTQAFSTCFMSDVDPKGPDGDIATAVPAYQDDAWRPQAAGNPVLLFRPAMQLPQMSLARGYGYIAAELYNSSTSAPYNYKGFTILPLHAILLWIGQDDSSRAYSILFDLDSFPSRLPAPVKVGDLHIVGSGALDVNKLEPGMKRDVAFARLAEPSHSMTAGVKHKRPFFPEGSWVNCSEGCCLVSAIAFSGNDGMNARKLKSQVRKK